MPPGVPNMMSIKRIHREIADLKKEDLGDIVITPDEKDVHVWRASLPGPQGSPYEGGVFDVEIRLGSDYPIYHMNISERGNICIDILKHNWSPALSIFKVLLSLSSLLTDPNPQDPLVPSIATQYVKNRKLHDTTAKQWVELYARPKKPSKASTSKSEGVAEGSSSSGRATRGKRKAAGDGNGMSEDGAGGSGSSRRSTRPRGRDVDVDEPIVIEDSDDEVEALGVAAPSSKRRKGGGGGDHASSTGTGTSRSRTSTRASTSARSRPREQLGDVIVIDDD